MESVGEICDCDETSSVNNIQQCVERNSTKMCHERGECVCGKCFCDDGYKGKFCECSVCDKIDGIECSNKGTCQCGICQCIDGWKGNACQCPSTDDLCIAPGSQEVCSGNGYCDCGECRCNATTTDGFKYRGTYCESSISSGGSGLCVLYDACVNATVENPDKADEFCRANNTIYNIERVKSVDKGNEHYCIVKSMKEKTTCSISYIYEFKKNNVVILKIENKLCNTSYTAVIGSVITIATLCFGFILLLIWKCWISIKDKKEYEKFKIEQEKYTKLYQNPLFKPATSYYQVPSRLKEN